ncbi:MAG: hypothetical protein IIV90_01580, partial [Oscillospiraceae bacterium]|nr:hypothetical protein [Oscillospiraceae bacterium]
KNPFVLFEIDRNAVLKRFVKRVEPTEDGEEVRYYIPEELKYDADVRFEAKGNGVTALVMRCNYMKEQNFPRELQDKALASCWHRFLSLCSQAKALQDPALLPRWCAEQERMRTLLGGVLGCKELTAAEKFSCLLWGTRRLPRPKKRKYQQ